MKVLVLTSEPISAEQLRDALSRQENPAQAEVMVVAPALQQKAIKFWFDDADEAIGRAQEVWKQSVDRLGHEGISASGDTGESDPELAIQDALVTFPADRVVVFSDPSSSHYREDLDISELEQRFGIPITQVGSASA